mmetsp:Transcript_9613/g.35640  ORF Transcript_9613/g.35640 Transcript_9613/m.35640 type:complete len:434 (+) Transcript_9613:2110-3411(+)
MGDSFVELIGSPLENLLLFFALALHVLFVLLSVLQESLGRIRPSVEDAILAQIKKILLNVGVHWESASIHDSHVHPSLDGMVQKDGVHRLANLFQSTEGETQVGYTSRHFCEWEVGLDELDSLNELDGILVVFLDTSGNGENVKIENYVLWWKINLLYEQIVGTLANFKFTLTCGCLSLLVEGHDNYSSTVASDQSCLLEEFLLSLFERDGVYNAFSLKASKPGLDNLHFGGVHHHWNFGNFWLRSNQFAEAIHCKFSIQKTFVHVDIENLSSFLNLRSGHLKSFRVLIFQNEILETTRSCNIASLSDIHKVSLFCENEWFQSGESHVGILRERSSLWLKLCSNLGNGCNVIWGTSTASTEKVDNTLLEEWADSFCHLLWGLIVLSKLIWETCIWISRHPAFSHIGNALDVRQHEICTKSTIQSNGVHTRVHH